MIYTKIIIELLKDEKGKGDIELLTLGLINEASDANNADAIRNLSYFLEGVKEACLSINNQEEQIFLEKIIKIINKKGDNYVTKN